MGWRSLTREADGRVAIRLKPWAGRIPNPLGGTWKSRRIGFSNAIARRTRRTTIDVEAPVDKARLDKVVADRFGLSRRTAQEAVRIGRIDLDGARCDEPGRMVALDAAIEYHPSRPKARAVKLQGRLEILHEDAQVIMIDKPAGLLTVGGASDPEDTLVDRVQRYLAKRHGAARSYVGVVHRLDKDTSGAVVLTRDAETTRQLQALFRTHDIERRYIALVRGSLAHDEGTIRLPLLPNRPGTLRRGVARRGEDGIEAITHYQVLERFGPAATLVACWLETGRTHQIRVHMAEIGHPVVGDRVYKTRESPTGGGPPRVPFARQALHAQTLGFLHPTTQQSIRVEAPMPADFTTLLADLRQRLRSPRSAVGGAARAQKRREAQPDQ
mgnify:CR=1 FL=1